VRRRKGGPRARVVCHASPVNVRGRSVALGVAVGAVAVGLGVGWFVLFGLRSGGSGPVAIDGSGPMSIWPETPFDPEDSLRRAQEEVDVGRDRWRLDATAVIVRFAQNVFGWDRIEFGDLTGGSTDESEVHTIRPACPDEDCVPSDAPWIGVGVDRLGRQGSRGIWSVVTVHSDRLQLPVEAGATVVAGDTLSFGLDLAHDQHAAVGLRFVQRLGGTSSIDCGDGFAGDVGVTGTGGSVTVPDPLFDDAACAGFGAVGYVFAYATPRLTVQTGDPLLEPAAITALSIVPARFSQEPVSGPGRSP
jgi:hypothetical protein